MGEGSLSMPPNYTFKFMGSSRGGAEDFLSSSSGVSITPIPTAQTYHTPSPDSAIHSVSGCYSPSQSPVQSRQVSGLSSPFSLASLSRNNSDASQHGSPNPTIYLSSPHDSPVQVRHNLGQTRSLGSSRPMTTFHAHPAGSDLSVVPASTDPSVEVDVYGAVSTQPGISRQQLIN